MKREIKFRAFIPLSGVWCFFGIEAPDIVHAAMKTEIRCFIMQYTGIKDKNGKEIYEGDIVKIVSAEYNGKKRHPDYVGAVVWDSSSLGYEVEIGKNDWMPLETSCEVIGNIYEHPELLKEVQP